MVEIIVTLKNGGAHLDFRSRDGMTALHKAARAKNQIALKVINDLILNDGIYGCVRVIFFFDCHFVFCFFLRMTVADLKQSSTVMSYGVSDSAEFTQGTFITLTVYFHSKHHLYWVFFFQRNR